MKSYQMSPPRQLISPVKESVPLPAKQVSDTCTSEACISYLGPHCSRSDCPALTSPLQFGFLLYEHEVYLSVFLHLKFLGDMTDDHYNSTSGLF